MFFMKKICFLLMTVLTTLTGCMFAGRSSKPVKEYDLALLGKPVPQRSFYISSFSSEAPAKHRMLYRKNQNIIEQDPYNNWIQRPENMLSRYFRQMFPLTGGTQISGLIEVRASVTAFEIDLTDAEAVLGLYVTLKRQNVRKSFSLNIREKVSARTPDAFAQAMSKAAWRAGEAIKADVERFAAAKE